VGGVGCTSPLLVRTAGAFDAIAVCMLLDPWGENVVLVLHGSNRQRHRPNNCLQQVCVTHCWWCPLPAGPQALEPEQLQKIEAEASVVAEIRSLGGEA
jgi:hypothetical protein